MNRPIQALAPCRQPARLVVWLMLAGMALAGSACSSFDADEPVVPDSLLVEVLVDLHLAQARLEHGYRTPVGLRDSILEHHGLDTGTFRETIEAYLDRPEEYAALYNLVLDRLNEERIQLHPARPPDSLALMLPELEENGHAPQADEP